MADGKTPKDAGQTAPSTQDSQTAPQANLAGDSAALAPANEAGPLPKADEAPNGGRFMVNGQLVNAEGKAINEDGSLKTA